MKTTCLSLAPDGGMTPEDEATALARWRAGEGPYWIHLSDVRWEEMAAWLVGLDLDPELLDLLQAGGDETSIVPLADAVFVSYPVPAGAEAWEPAHFGLLCLDRLVITIQPESLLLEATPLARLRLREGTAAGVVCALALLHSARLRRHVVTLRRQGDVLTDRMDSDPWAVSIDEILALKRRVLALGGVVDEQLAVLQVLKASELPVLPLRRLAELLQVAIEISRATDRDIDRLDRRAHDLHERIESAQQERIDRRLSVLTVVSAIFMPLTLIAGIYGMNFELMPELHYRYGYPLVLGGMAAIAGGLGWYFRARWWSK